MESLSSSSLRDQANDVIRAAIVSGELRPGEIHSAAALGKRLGVSATPIREAMVDLAKTGLVEPVRNRGFRILTVDEQDLDEIGELRMLLEPPSMRKIAELASDSQLSSLGSVVDDLEAAAAKSDVTTFLVADRRFHLSLLEIVGNARLVRLIAELRDQTRLVGLRPLAESDSLAESAREHRDVLEALEERDGRRAEELMRRHLRHTRGIWAGRKEPGVDVAELEQPRE